MPDLDRRLRDIVSAVTIESPLTFTFAGESVEVPPGSNMSDVLQRDLYQSCFVVPFEGRRQPSRPIEQDDAFEESLAGEVGDDVRWDDGWQFLQSQSDGSVWAKKGAVLRLFRPGFFLIDLGASTSISTRLVPYSRHLQPGYFFLQSDEPWADQDDRRVLRFYWNVPRETAGRLIRAHSKRLNEFQLPFRLKVLSSPQHAYRCDAAVLYVPASRFRLALELVTEIHRTVAAGLRPDVPLFTRRVLPGLSFAEDPGGAQSFGMVRCGMLARAILAARRDDVEDRGVVVLRALSQQGLSLDRPYLNAGSRASYEFDS